MNNTKFSCSRLISFFTLRIVICGNSGKETSVESFIGKLEQQIELSRNHSEECANSHFTAFRVNDCNIEINDLIALYQSLYGKINLQDSVTVITVVFENNSNMNSDKDRTDKIISAIQKLINEKRQYIEHFDLSVKIEYVKQEQPADTDSINKMVHNIESIQNKLDDIVIELFYEICCATFEEIATYIIQNGLQKLLDDKIRPHIENATDLKQFAKKEFMAFKKFLHITRKWSFRESLQTFMTRHDKFFTCVSAKILEYEARIDFEHFTNDRAALVESYRTCIKYTLDIALDKGTHGLIARINVAFGGSRSKNMYVKMFCLAALGMIQDCNESRIVFRDYIDKHNYVYSFCEKREFNLLINDYINNLVTDKIKLDIKKVIQIIANKAEKEKVIKKTFKIILNRDLSKRGLYRLCNVLEYTRACTKLYKHQCVYIESRKYLQEDVMRPASRKNNISSYELMTPCTLLETFHVSQLPRAVCGYTYNRVSHSIIELNRSGRYDSVPRNKYYKTKIETLVTVKKYDSETYATLCICSVVQLINRCLKPGNSDLASLYAVKITNITNSTLIYVFSYMPKDPNQGIRNTVIYYVSYEESEAFLELYKPPTKILKSFDNVQISFLNDLYICLQSVLLTKNTQFVMPNVYSIGKNEFIYQQQTFDLVLNENPFFVIRRYLDSMYAYINPYRMYEGISYKLILECCHDKNHKIMDFFVNIFVKRLGIGKRFFFEIYYKFILDKNLAYKPEDSPFPKFDREYSNYGVQVYVKHHTDKSVILQLNEVKAYNNYNNFSINLKAIIERVKCNQNNAAIWNFLDQVFASLGIEMTIMRLIIRDMCKAMKTDLDLGSCDDVGASIQQYINPILRSIDTLSVLMHGDCKENNTCKHHSTLEDINRENNYQHFCKAQEVEHFLDTIVNELKDLARTRTYKFTSIKLGSLKSIERRRRKMDVELTEKDEVYNDITHFNCQKCQIIYKYY